ncbi:MAG: glycosyltransferase family 4 protein [Candidatus Staskawiczbacteria bacterium]|nr:glycosyltransferase family 4 protein [Candidatus Staskawiczbacteria bacterium]
MKIVILTAVFKSENKRGIEVATYNTAKYLAKKGHEVHVIASGRKELFKETVEANFYVRRISYPKIPSLGFVYFWLKIPFYIKNINPDIVHCQNTQMGIPALLYKKFFKTPYVVLGHGSDIYLDWKLKKIINKLVFGNADKIIALTEDMKKNIQKTCKKEVVVIPNGISLENFEGLSKEESRRKLEIGPDEKIVFFAGGLHAVKGLEYLITAFKIIKEKMPEARLILAGEGTERRKLERLARRNDLKEQVSFIGNVPNNKIPGYMISSDIFALPSLSEGLPIVILEAMASGLPIVASRVRGIPEILKDKENGFLVEPKNPVKLAEKILCLLSDSELRKQISLKNKEAVKKYSLDSITEELLKIYSLCLKKSKKPEKKFIEN